MPGTSSVTVSTKREPGDGVETAALSVERRFASTKGTPYYRLQHRRASFDEVVALRVEGVSIWATARVKGLAWNTVARWLDKAADACRRFNHGMTIGFAVEELQADEIRTFAGSKDWPTWVFAVDRSLVSPLAIDNRWATQLPEHFGADS